MANWFEPTEENLASFKEWIATRPEHIRPVVARFPPWGLFKMRDTGQRVTVYCVSEHKDGGISLVVDVTGQFNFLLMERRVFGIDPDNLEPCDLPKKDELIGSLEIPLEMLTKRSNKIPRGENN